MGVILYYKVVVVGIACSAEGTRNPVLINVGHSRPCLILRDYQLSYEDGRVYSTVGTACRDY